MNIYFANYITNYEAENIYSSIYFATI